MAERCIISKRVKAPRVKDWVPPAPDVLKFNVDGSVRGSTGMAGMGGVA